jgi:hypothetical protein
VPDRLRINRMPMRTVDDAVGRGGYAYPQMPLKCPISRELRRIDGASSAPYSLCTSGRTCPHANTRVRDSVCGTFGVVESINGACSAFTQEARERRRRCVGEGAWPRIGRRRCARSSLLSISAPTLVPPTPLR